MHYYIDFLGGPLRLAGGWVSGRVEAGRKRGDFHNATKTTRSLSDKGPVPVPPLLLMLLVALPTTTTPQMRLLLLLLLRDQPYVRVESTNKGG